MNFKDKTSKKIISALLIIFIMAPSVLFFAPRASAQTPDLDHLIPDIPCGPYGTACATSTGQTKGNLISKISAIFNGTSATQNTITAGVSLKEWALKIAQEALRNIAKKFLQKMTESTVNWINSGFHGSPLYVENPSSFFGDIAKFEIRNLVSQIGSNSAQQPFGKSFALNLINNFKSTFQQNAQYSLSKVTNDPELLENFRTNFSTGGWDGFLLTTQFPQNNEIGAQIMYSDYITGKLAGTAPTATDKIKTTLEQGQGFLSPQKCTGPNADTYNNLKNEFTHPTYKPSDQCAAEPVDQYKDCTEGSYYMSRGGMTATLCNQINASIKFSWQQACAKEKADWDAENSCLLPDGTSGLVNTTPGSVVANQIMNSLTSGQRQGELSMAMGNSLSAIFDALLNHFLSAGLNGLSSKLNGSTSKSKDTFDWNQAPDKPTNIDNLNYDGQKFLGGPQPVDPAVQKQFNPDYSPANPAVEGN